MTAGLINAALLLIALLMLLPMLIFSVECLASVLPDRRRRRSETTPRPRAAVLIPAHDEAAGIGATLDSVLPTLDAGDRLLVVADNCGDRTAEIARKAGAEVIERHDPSQRGKAYALAFGVRHLESDPPDVVIVIDADCTIEADLVPALASEAHASQNPVQALFLCEPGPDAPAVHSVSGLGYRFKNLVRPLGLARLGLPCHLMGSGMAFPWSLIHGVRLAGDSLVEDLQLGIDLAQTGHFARFIDDVRVTTRMSSSNRVFRSQRTRWEHGQLGTAITEGPRLAGLALRRLDPKLLLFVLHLFVLPLSLVLVLGMVTTTALVAAWLLGAWWLPAALLIAAFGLMALAVALGWLVHCRKQFPLTTLLMTPLYVARKLPIYASFLSARQRSWDQSGRSG